VLATAGARVVGAVPPPLAAALPASARARSLLLLNRAVRRVPRTFAHSRTAFGFVVAGSTADLIQRYLYVFGVWEPNLSYWLRDHLRPGDVVVDVGANIGYFSLLGASCVGPTGRVIAFEPVPSIADALEKAVAANGYLVEVHREVASDVVGTTEVFRAAEGNIGRSSTIAGDDAASEGLIRTVRVADVVDAASWPRITFVKVDVEGDEMRVLRGMEPLLRALSPDAAVLVEVSPDDLEVRGGSAAELLTFMENAGFQPFAVQNSYAARDYAHFVREEPRPLTAVPTTQSDVLFRKVAP
jgi:FkbM family methyltransferase